MLHCTAPNTPCTPTTPDTPTIPATPFTPHHSPVTPCSAVSRSSSQQNVDTDSGKSSCSPALLDCSFDSGICVEINDMELKCKLKDYKRILQVLEKEREIYRLLRERLSKIVDRKTKKQQKEEISCNVCCAELDVEDTKSFVTCCACDKIICRDTKCSDWLPDNAQWECHTCHSSKASLAHTSSWVAEQLSFNQHKFIYPMRARSEIYIPINDPNDSSMHFESVSQIGGSASTTALGAAAAIISNEQKLKIREYVEEVVAQMLGGSLDSVAVGQISKSESYLPALINGHQPNNTTVGRSGDFADLSQTRLRQLIETIIAETLRLPLSLSSGAVSEVAFDIRSNGGGNALTLANGDVRRHRTEHYFEPKIYQDLLATAVLNKIADTHGNAGHLSESSPQFISTDANQNFHENQSTSSGSSIEPRSDCSFTDTDQIINLSKGEIFSLCGSNSNLNADEIAKLQLDAGRESALSDYIAAHMVPLPDLSTPATESEEDDYVSVTSSQMGDGNWEDNWLFKKKKSSLKATVSTGSIGMLVPAPKEDVRAQIGDKIADEISDLSEMGSDTDDSSLDILRGQLDPLNNRLLNKHLIGGQNTKMVLDELIERSSMISATSPTENEPIYTETKNKHVINPTTNKEAINTTVTKSLLQSSPPSTDTLTDTSDPVILPPPCHFDDTANGEATLEADAAVPITGSIAEREYKKWYNAVDMPNNPYAPDALKRRISGSQEKFIDLPNISPSTEQNPISLLGNTTTTSANEECQQNKEIDYKRYSRDYYINDIKVQDSSKKPITLSNAATNSQESVDITINEETTVIRESNIAAVPRLSTASTQSTSLESNNDLAQDVNANNKERPTDLSLTKGSTSVDAVASAASTSAAVTSPPPFTPTRGSTPTAFKFLQPKRKLIDPSQVLSLDEEDVPPAPPVERKTIEDEVAHVLPSVKALAQAFLMTSHKCPQVSGTRRWPIKLKKTTSEPVKISPIPVQPKLLEASPASVEVGEDATIASDLSSLETDPSIQHDALESDINADPSAAGTSPVPVRSGFLRSNIAFFENLKFK